MRSLNSLLRKPWSSAYPRQHCAWNSWQPRGSHFLTRSDQLPSCFPIFRQNILERSSATRLCFQLSSRRLFQTTWARTSPAASHTVAPLSKPASSKAGKSLKHDRAALSGSNSQPFSLDRWRVDTKNLRWHWGEETAEEIACKQPNSEDLECTTSGKQGIVHSTSLADYAVQVRPIPLVELFWGEVLKTSAPRDKIAMTHAAWKELNAHGLEVGSSSPPDQPARPECPKLVAPKLIPKAKESGLPLNVFVLLNLAHVELNAIDLAWDTVARFSHLGLPKEFYQDFAHVADDESRHLGWCLQRLQELGFDYGDMPAHNMLWEGAQKSAEDVMARLVLVPCSQEARGLDAGPRLVERLASIPDHRSAAIVARISCEELAHVAVGTFWFRSIAAALNQDGEDAFRRWMQNLCPELLNGQFNHAARATAGLSQAWYDGKLWPPALTLEPPKGLKDLEAGQLHDLQRRLSQLLELEESFA